MAKAVVWVIEYSQCLRLKQEWEASRKEENGNRNKLDSRQWWTASMVEPRSHPIWSKDHLPHWKGTGWMRMHLRMNVDIWNALVDMTEVGYERGLGWDRNWGIDMKMVQGTTILMRIQVTLVKNCVYLCLRPEPQIWIFVKCPKSCFLITEQPKPSVEGGP